MRDDGRNLELAGDFLPVRSTTRHVVLHDGPSRARLEVRRSGNRLEVTNGLGVDVDRATSTSLGRREMVHAIKEAVMDGE